MQETTNLKLKKPDLTDYVNVGDLNENSDKIDAAFQTEKEKLATHLADYLKHTGYAVATGSVNSYIATLDPVLSAYQEGVSLRLKINVTNTGASTLNVNGLGAKPIKKSNGSAVAAGNLKLGSIYTLAYDGASFILQGEGGSGNLQPNQALAGKTFTNDDGEQIGVGDPNLVSYNIKQGVNLFGVTGSLNKLASVSAGNNVIASKAAYSVNVRRNTVNTIWGITANVAGTYRCTTTISSISVDGAGNFGMYVNDVLATPESFNSQFNTYPVTITFDVTVAEGQTIRLKNNTTGYTDGTGANGISSAMVGITETPITSTMT